MGSLRFRDTSRGEVQLESGGGDPLFMERLSSSEQREPLLDESTELAGCVAGRSWLFKLKKLPSCAAATFISACRVLLLLLLFLLGGKVHVLLLVLGPPYIGSCFTVPGLFFSCGETGAERSSSSAWIK